MSDHVPWPTNAWDEIIPNLYQGGALLHPPTDEFPKGFVRVDDQFDLVISLYKEWGSGPADGVEEHHLRIPDGELSEGQIREVRKLSQVVRRAVEGGRKTLVRCQAGYNRSGLVVALALVDMGYTPEDAIALIREKRSPYALFNGYFIEIIKGARDDG